MGCNCGSKNNQQASFPKPEVPKFPTVPPPEKKELKISVVGNLIEAAKSQSNPVQWFKDGISGLIKCIGQVSIYSDEDIKKNREVCATCEYSTKKEGKLNNFSQCMAPDPAKNGAKCGCKITCKSQSDFCPLKKWTTTPLTINKEPTK